MNKEWLMEGWHLDKRVSVSHIITTITVAGMLMVWMFTLESRVTVNEVRIDTMQEADGVIRAEVRALGSSILAKLDSMEKRQDDQMDTLQSRQYEHIKEHSDNKL